jgi:hypothetical protein
VKDGIVVRHVDHLPVGEDERQALHERHPLVPAVEVVDHQEPAAQQVLAQPRRLLGRQRPPPHLDRVEPRVVEELVVHDADRALEGARVDGREATHALQEVLVGRRPVDPRRAAPAATAPTPTVAVVQQPHERILRGLGGVGGKLDGHFVGLTLPVLGETGGTEQKKTRNEDARALSPSHAGTPFVF